MPWNGLRLAFALIIFFAPLSQALRVGGPRSSESSILKKYTETVKNHQRTPFRLREGPTRSYSIRPDVERLIKMNSLVTRRNRFDPNCEAASGRSLHNPKEIAQVSVDRSVSQASDEEQQIKKQDNAEPSNAFIVSEAGNRSIRFVASCTAGDCDKKPSKTRQLEHYNTCEGPITLNACEAMAPEGTHCSRVGSCSQNLIMEVEFADSLRQIFPRCVKKAAFDAYKIRPQKIKSIQVVHSGTLHVRYVRGGAIWSSHAYGTSIDIRQINLNLDRRSQKTIQMHIAKQTIPDMRFYDSLRECWDESGGEENCCCHLGYDHPIERIRELHQDHLHLTYRCGRGDKC